MKKSIYISGIASANLMLFGSLFKVMHWPGAGVILTLAVIIFCFGFLPAALKSSYDENGNKQFKWLYLVTFMVFFISMMGVLFKVQHWPGAGIFLLAGIPLPFVLFLPVYLYQTRNEDKRDNMSFLGMMFGLTFLAVFSVLLSLSVSKSILTRIGNNMVANEQFSLMNSAQKNSRHASNFSTGEAETLCKLINELKCSLLTASGNEPCSSEDPSNVYIPSELKNQENSDEAMNVICGDGKANKIEELKNIIGEYKNSVLASTALTPELKSLVEDLFEVNDKTVEINGETGLLTWEQRTFPNYKLIFVLDILTEIESNVRFVEGELAEGAVFK